MIDDKTLAKMENARHLFEPPADEVVGDLLNEIAALKNLVAEMRGALAEVRLHLHSQGRRPETCHEMSVIDEALRLERPAAGRGVTCPGT